MENNITYINPNELSKKEAYFLAISAIVPRPIALITTVNEDGQSVNAAPFSYFTGLSSQPAMVAFSIANGRNGKKDTLKNILRDKDFVIHIPVQGMEQNINICAIDFPYGESELRHTDFSYRDCQSIKGKRIEQIPLAMECRYTRSIEESGNFTLVMAEVLCYSILPDYYQSQEKLFEYHKTVPLGRMGKSEYLYADHFTDIPRQSYREWQKNNS